MVTCAWIVARAQTLRTGWAFYVLPYTVDGPAASGPNRGPTLRADSLSLGHSIRSLSERVSFTIRTDLQPCAPALRRLLCGPACGLTGSQPLRHLQEWPRWKHPKLAARMVLLSR